MSSSAVLLTLLLACGQAESPDPYMGLRVRANLDPSLSVDQLSMTITNLTAIERLRPDLATVAKRLVPPAPRRFEPNEDFVVLLPPQVAGAKVEVQIDALAGGKMIGAAKANALAINGHLVDLPMHVAPCGVCVPSPSGPTGRQ